MTLETIALVTQKSLPFLFEDLDRSLHVRDIQETNLLNNLFKTAGLANVSLSIDIHDLPKRKINAQLVRSKSEYLEVVLPEDVSIDKSTGLFITFELFFEQYCFFSTCEKTENIKCFVYYPNSVFLVHHRDLDRTQIPKEEIVTVKIKEVSGRRSLLGNILDLSVKGLKINIPINERCDSQRILGFERDVIMTVNIPGVDRMDPIPGRVTNWFNGVEAVHIGTSCFIPLSVGDQESVEDFLLDKKYPNVKRSKSSSDHLQVWRLLQKTLEKIAPPDMTRKDESIITWKKTSWCRRPIHNLYLLYSDQAKNNQHEAIGTIAVSRFYSKTWLLHQLGVDGSSGQLLSHQLYGRTLDFLRNTDDVKYTIGTWPKASSVLKKYYLEFIERDPFPQYHYLEQTNVVDFYVVKVLSSLKARVLPTNIKILEANARQCQEILQDLRNKYPDIFLDALDLRDFDMHLESTNALYESVSLKRGRNILSAMDGNELKGYAILDYGSKYQNVYSLFDNFKIFTLGNDSRDNEIKLMLLREVMVVYHSMGIEMAMSWTKDKILTSGLDGTDVFLEAYLWVANTKRMKSFLRHLDSIQGRINVIRGARKKSDQ